MHCRDGCATTRSDTNDEWTDSERNRFKCNHDNLHQRRFAHSTPRVERRNTTGKTTQNGVPVIASQRATATNARMRPKDSLHDKMWKRRRMMRTDALSRPCPTVVFDPTLPRFTTVASEQRKPLRTTIEREDHPISTKLQIQKTIRRSNSLYDDVDDDPRPQKCRHNFLRCVPSSLVDAIDIFRAIHEIQQSPCAYQKHCRQALVQCEVSGLSPSPTLALQLLCSS